jgi:pimeloyl-ACP methyl ester carboxylesterase
MALKTMALTKLMLVGNRAPIDRSPADVGLEYEDVIFRASDGLALRGWFIPRADPEPGPVVLFLHGWLWNRLGNKAGLVPVPDKDVDFLPATRALHDAGISVLLFDLRNHGESAADPPITYGPNEAKDYAGAVAFLRRRPEVDPDRIGVLGCSMGANTALYGSRTGERVKALLAVQPARLANFNRNFMLTEFGRFGPAMLKPVDPLYRILRRPMPKDHDPAVPARDMGDTVVQYVQGTGDPWGRMEDVEAMVQATPNALPLVRFESAGRYEGYRYVNEAVDDVAAFFKEHL